MADVGGRRLVWNTGIMPLFARRGVEHGSGLGVHRWVVEQGVALCTGAGGWEIRDDIHEAFLSLTVVAGVGDQQDARVTGRQCPAVVNRLITSRTRPAVTAVASAPG